MSLFGSLSLMADVEDDPFFGSHMRHMRQMNNMMNSLFSDPFGMLGGDGPLAIMGPRHGNAMMPFMPQMPTLNRLFTDMDGSNMHVPGSSFSSSTVVMSSGPNGKPQVYSSSSSTKIGPHGIKETCKTMQDSRTGTKKMAIGHHIGERAHLIEREQNYYTGDAEERQEFINLEEEEAEDFNREFQYKAGSAHNRGGQAAICGRRNDRRNDRRLALPAPPAHSPHATHAPHAAHSPHASHAPHAAQSPHASHAPPAAHATHAPTVLPTPMTMPSLQGHNTSSESATVRRPSLRPTSRRSIRTAASPLTLPTSPSVREVYGGSQPQRHRNKHHKSGHRHPQPEH